MDVYPKCRLNVTYIEWLGMIKQKTKSETIKKSTKAPWNGITQENTCKAKTWMWLRCLEQVKLFAPQWWFDGDLP